MGQVFYTKEMAKAVREIKAPYKNVRLDIMKRPNYIALVIHENNIMEFGQEQRMNIMEYLLKVRSMIQSFGVRCEIEGIKYDK
jgi:hypothetical protein